MLMCAAASRAWRAATAQQRDGDEAGRDREARATARCRPSRRCRGCGRPRSGRRSGSRSRPCETSRSCSRLRGRLLEDRKMNTKNSGKRPWTASPEPVCSAAAQPSAPKPTAVSAPSTRITRRAAEARVAGGRRRSGRSGCRRRTAARRAPRRRPAARRSATTRRSGVSARRLKKPLSMSSARFVPVLISENMPPWMNATAIAKET